MEIEMHAEGPAASGKTFVLRKIAELLKSMGFEILTLNEMGNNVEYLHALREDDTIRLEGDRRISLGDWELELDAEDKLVDVFYKGNNVRAHEVQVNMGVTMLTEVIPKTIVKTKGR